MTIEPLGQRYVLDAHALRWYWSDPGRLSPAAAAVFEVLERGEAEALVPVIVVAELYYLAARLRDPMSVDSILGLIDRAPSARLEPLTRRHLLAFAQLGSVPEMHDRFIAAVALVENATIVTRDPQLHGHPLVRAIW